MRVTVQGKEGSTEKEKKREAAMETRREEINAMCRRERWRWRRRRRGDRSREMETGWTTRRRRVGKEEEKKGVRERKRAEGEMMRGLCKPEAVSPRGVFVIGYTLSLV